MAEDRKALEDLCYQRLKGSRLRLEDVQLRLHKLLSDNPLVETYNADGHSAYTQAIRDETVALGEYARAMRIYEDLTVRGVLPHEDPLAKEAGAEG